MSRRPAHALRFRGDGRFVVVQLTDLHLGSSTNSDRRTRDLIETVLDAAAPDLVVLTGDILEGQRAVDPGSALRVGLASILERRIPWAPILGNHDDEGRFSRRQVFGLLRSLPGCRGTPGATGLSGVGNYVLCIRGRRHQPAFTFYMFDSHAYAPSGFGTYAWIQHDQIAWYRASRAERRVPALAFLHIPLPEWELAWREGWNKRGHRHEAACCPSVNSGLFAAFLERGDVIGAFCGHDHLNDYEATLHGIRLVYGRASGHGGYGRPGFPRGARVIELREGVRGFETRVVTPDLESSTAGRGRSGDRRG